MGIVRSYGGPDTFDGGFDYKDVLGDVLKEFFDSDASGWKESKGSLEAFLGKILHNRIVDHLRRQKHVAGSLDEADYSAAKHDGAKGVHGKAPERARVDLASKLYELVGDDTALKDLVTAAQMTSGTHNMNQEMGEILDKTPHQISKLKDRLLKKEGVRELYASRQATRSRS